MRKKQTRSAVIRHAAGRSHPKHLDQTEMLLLVVVVVVLIGIVGWIMGVLPSFWGYPKVLSAMVGR